MLVTLSSQGASLVRLELSSKRYRDLEDRSGYLGHLVIDNSDKGPGCLVQVVGAGTPAAKADIRPGDRVREVVYQDQTTQIDGWAGPSGLETALRKTRPERHVELVIDRGDKKGLKKDVLLIRRPLEVIRPERSMPSAVWDPNGQPDAISWESNCPPSLLTTLQQVGDDKLVDDPNANMSDALTQQLPGVELRSVNWNLESQESDQPGGPITKAAFSCIVPKYQLKLTKTYELKKVDGDAPAKNVDARAYHLVLNLQITNLDSKPRDVAYRLDGPNGLPVEGAWYASKVQKTGLGLRNVVYDLKGKDFDMVACSELSEKPSTGEKFRKDMVADIKEEHLPLFFGVNAQYFSAALLPDADSGAAIDRAVAFRVGQIEEQRKTLTNTSFRLIGKPSNDRVRQVARRRIRSLCRPETLHAAGEVQHAVPGLLWMADLRRVRRTHDVDPGQVLHRRAELRPGDHHVDDRRPAGLLAREPQAGAKRQLMQKVQPKLKELEKKHKGDWKALQAAKQELLAKYNYNPASGCLMLLFQLPIFIGLYRALQVNVELRDAPLIPFFPAVRWCSNLAAPDMLFDWSRFMPEAVNNGIGFPGIPLIGPIFGTMLGLGPYLNLFPIITLVLFLVQQKVMMPPAADEQAAQQQKIMKYVMFLMGLMFFKVAAGLCIYFIATTLWGLAEKRFLPQPATADADSGETAAAPARTAKIDRLSNAEREAIRRKKGRKK